MAATQSTKLEQLLRKIQPCQFASYQEFIRALMIETLANTNMTFDQLNYDLFALNREVFHQVNRETTAFFKLLANKQQCFLADGPTTSQDQYWAVQQTRGNFTANGPFATRLQKVYAWSYSTEKWWMTFFKKLFLTTRCMHQKKLSPMGFKHVRTVTSIVFYKTHVVQLITTYYHGFHDHLWRR